MTDQPPYPGRPGWVKVALLVAAGATVLVVLLLVFGGGRHGPGRHLPGAAGGDAPAAAQSRGADAP